MKVISSCFKVYANKWNRAPGCRARANAAQVKKAIAAAKAASASWRYSSTQARFDALDFIGTKILAREEGKTLPEGIREAGRAGQVFKFFADEALRIVGDKLHSVRPGIDVEITRETLGVIGIITPWNFPIVITLLESCSCAGL